MMIEGEEENGWSLTRVYPSALKYQALEFIFKFYVIGSVL